MLTTVHYVCHVEAVRPQRLPDDIPRSGRATLKHASRYYETI
jgi:hypothetical protein